MAKFNELKYELLEHPAYSPDLAPSDYYLFPNLKKFLAGKRFTSNDEAIAAVDGYFAHLPESHFNNDLNGESPTTDNTIATTTTIVMYNLNVNVNPSPTAGAAAGLLGVAAAEVTPRTPEIVNSLIAMTNPFEGYNSNEKSRDRTDSTSSGEPSPPSVQHTCSQLIKEGLKLTLQTKRRANGSGDEGRKKLKKEDGSADDEEEEETSNNNKGGLTPEDEERRRRRRERNKIAATKCRLKKREKTVILVQESEILETQNHDLKSQIQELETQRRRLVDMLSLHTPTCLKQGADSATSYQQFAEPIQLPSYQDNFVQQAAPPPPPPPPALNQPQNCVTEYHPVKVEEYEADFYRQGSPYVPTTSDAGCTV
ncbi:activating transcription factor 3 isoform X2 [Harpegnathos saltator]|uniref:activating transcription factor 3 isoform X2 n=1 Tax=Harpegnathos saltator TaxID=610380 RepID=UPI000DBED269|nr:activating transcription factor 3 isoform X2 [Harpegnathos saltator]